MNLNISRKKKNAAPPPEPGEIRLAPIEPRQQKEILTCPGCKGVGMDYRKNPDGSPYLRLGRPVTEPCRVCAGHGRVLQVITEEYWQMPPMLSVESINGMPQQQ